MLKDSLLSVLGAIDGGDPDIYAEAAALNAPTVEEVYPRRVTYLDLYEGLDITHSGGALTRYTEAKALVAKIKASADEDVAEVRPCLEVGNPTPGLDVGSPVTRLMIQSKVPDVFSQSEADALLALGVRKVSKAQAAGLPKIRAGWLRYSRGELAAPIGGAQ